MLYTRRDFGRIAIAAVPLATALANINSRFGGVEIGAITYSFREIHELDPIIKMMTEIGLGEVELMSNHAETAAGAPAPPARPAQGSRSRGERRRREIHLGVEAGAAPRTSPADDGGADRRRARPQSGAARLAAVGIHGQVQGSAAAIRHGRHRSSPAVFQHERSHHR